MTPALHLDKARRLLESGHHSLAGSFPDDAGRNAYLAGFHAALAYIVYRCSKEPKTHSGTRSEFARLARDEPLIGRTHVAFLGSAYELKTWADYAGDVATSPEDAAAALTFAATLVDLIAALVSPSG